MLSQGFQGRLASVTNWSTSSCARFGNFFLGKALPSASAERRSSQFASMQSLAEADRARGAVLGTLVGDAAGVPLEFKGVVTDSDVQHALQFPGGGALRAGRYQISDDSELALALATGLLNHAATTATARSNSVAQQYCRWHDSDPFDCGVTCRRAFSLSADTPDLAARMRQQAAASNMSSKANGALMRLSPLIVFGHSLPQSELVRLVKEDAALSHPNQTCQDANALYAIAIAYLIQNPGDSEGALSAAEAYSAAADCQEVKAWLEESKGDCSDLDCKQLIGFVKWAFILSFWHLRQRSTFTAALTHTLGRAGDTDTNAAIVGAMMGALHGMEAIPSEYKKVLDYSHGTCGGHLRPDWLQPGLALQHTDKLFAAACAGFDI